jgi:DNA-binding protein HU-beta
MTKAELLERIMNSQELPAGLTKKCVGELLDIAFGELANYFARAKITKSSSPRFTYPGFGTFTKKRRPSRRGVHPQTLAPIHIDGFETLDFKPGLELKRALNRNAESAEPRAANRPSAKQEAQAPSIGRRSTVASPSGRRLAVRDGAEVEAFEAAPAIEVILPGAPLQSVAKPARSRARAKSG